MYKTFSIGFLVLIGLAESSAASLCWSAIDSIYATAEIVIPRLGIALRFAREDE